MEVAATAIGVLGLAGLYTTCVHMLDTLSAAARYGIDRELLQTKIEVERVRLMIWGEAVGLNEINLDPSKTEVTEDELAVLDESLQTAALLTAVAGLLTCFVRTFEDVEVLQKRYGLVPPAKTKGKEKDPTTTTVAEKPTGEILLTTFRKTYSSFKNRTASAQKQASPLTKARWVVADEPKFRDLLTQLKAINDSLTALLPAVRKKTHVKMRDEIMRSNDAHQLQNLVNAADDIADLISETASLRLEMLSTGGHRIPAKPVPRVVHVATTADPSAVAVRQRALASDPTSLALQTSSPVPVSQPLNTRPSPAAEQVSGLGPREPLFGPYDDTGSLVIHKVYYKPDRFSCYSWLSGIGEAPELEEIQPVFHPAFALRFIPDSILDVAKNILEVDVEADAKYAGWSPGSTSLTGWAAELSFWREMGKQPERFQRNWRRVSGKPSLSSDFVHKRWKAITRDGLGEDWTEKRGFEQVRQLVGPSEYTWLDPEEGFKIRHQISDLLADMSNSPVPSFEGTGCIGIIACETANPRGNFNFVDVLVQLVEAREVTLRIASDKRRWYGGITDRIVYDMIVAELWGQNMELKDNGMFEAHRTIKERQLDGIIKFAEEMEWPYVDEMRDTVTKLLGPKADELQIHIRAFDWASGLVLPGGPFSMAILGMLYSLSTTLTTRMPNTVVPARKGNYGIVYPQASYWSVRSVLGKVLAPLTDARGSRMKCLGGFVGPCLSPSLPESTFGLMLELQARQVISDMEETNLDGGMARTVMPVVESKQGKAADWVEPMPPPMSTDSVKLQTLRLGKVATDPVTTGTVATGDRKPPRYTARLDFWLAKSKTMATMTLRSNSIFMAAPPCRGTHRIDSHEASQYTFQVLEIRDLPRAEPGAGMGNAAVIVINATSGEAAHTFARAWCSHRARNAVVWKREGGRCCFKCALMLAGKIGVATGILIVG
ncbi:prion-inhibition and propagation-domain-containing protein [Fusarium solani]|uniref:Prion-inhibition and propagation-domain-containing protein n=1 Tax=Fusarium solani TaxID=169388 RepID=A0A9P9KYV2_FUSSL|nr:prion-inhibition and propagation-domain-containing protein [Fusarium solani]KAH7270926.1 prion-inhibition and propagation-domain-containing protein [Fusarium solani]